MTSAERSSGSPITSPPRRLRVAIIAPPRFPIREPFSGGLEAHVWHLAAGLRERGHQVTLFACTGSDRADPAVSFEPPDWTGAETERSDTTLTGASQQRQDRTFQRLLTHLHANADAFDVIHNQSLDPAPLGGSGSLPVPMVTTLHTPPFRELTDVLPSSSSELVAVSGSVADAWAGLTRRPQVIHNGVDFRRWPSGPGGQQLVWFGRIVPEKAPHEAVRIAQSIGRPIALIGRIGDAAYFDQHVAPALRDPSVTYHGHLPHDEIADIVGHSSVTLVTPHWDEPFGLVAIESAACGTPVVAYRRGGLTESVVDGVTGYLGSTAVGEMGALVQRAQLLCRGDVRRESARRFALAGMVERYEALYCELAPRSRLDRSA